MILICSILENCEDANLFDVSLTDGKVRVTCEGVRLWDTDAETLEYTFYEWIDLAEQNEPGFTVTQEN